MFLQKRTVRAFECGQLAESAIREHDRPGQLGDQLLHRMPYPPARVTPERHAEIRVVPFERAQQADNALLHQLQPRDHLRSPVHAGNAGDQWQERLDQLLTSAPVTGPSALHE